jgi:hypothetical protein
MERLSVEVRRKTEAEAIYTRERQRVNLERFRAYYDDFQAACNTGNYRRVSEIVQDARTIADDTMRLVRKMSGIHTRLRMLRSDEHTTRGPQPAPDAGTTRMWLIMTEHQPGR